MARFVPLSKSAHREAGIRSAGLGFASKQAAVPLVADELPHVLPLMVVAFVEKADGNGVELAALQALEPENNVYVHTNGRWITGYRPAWYRTHPFRLFPEESSDRLVLCVNEESEAFQSEAGPEDNRLFTADGEPAKLALDVMEFLQKLEKSRQVTQALVDQLYEAGVIVPWQLSVSSPKGESGREVAGLYHIDEKALRALDAGLLSRLAGNGALSIAYSQLLSEHRLPVLVKMYELRGEASRQAAKPEVDIESLFADDDDDNLSF